MPSHSEGPGIWLSVWKFLLTHCLYERAAKVLARLRGCAGSPEPSLLAYAISTKFAWRGPNCKWPHTYLSDFYHHLSVIIIRIVSEMLTVFSQSALVRASLIFFSPSTIRAWNILPQDIKDANTLTAFKHRLNRNRQLPPKWTNFTCKATYGV